MIRNLSQLGSAGVPGSFVHGPGPQPGFVFQAAPFQQTSEISDLTRDDSSDSTLKHSRCISGRGLAICFVFQCFFATMMYLKAKVCQLILHRPSDAD